MVGMASKLRHSIYVIELDKDVLKEAKFLEANPAYVEGEPCVYVGMTGKDPEVRFAEHKRGYKSAKYVFKYGLYLKPRQFRCHNPMTYDDACKMEVEKARRLRNRGWGVWQK